jgi:hypothetical protein
MIPEKKTIQLPSKRKEEENNSLIICSLTEAELIIPYISIKVNPSNLPLHKTSVYPSYQYQTAPGW